MRDQYLNSFSRLLQKTRWDLKKWGMVLGVVFVLGCLQGVAFADYYSREFGDMDANHDDFVSFEEYRFYVTYATIETFKEIDTNTDETIDFFEWVEFQEKNDPFESKRGFKYKGKTGTWTIDRHGNRHKGRFGSYYRRRHDCRLDHWYGYRHDRWFDHRYGPWRRHHHGFFGWYMGNIGPW